MRLKNMYTVPKGQKVTEKQLLRVLTASICSIVLCMSCLVGTTWALFTVSIENTDNVIQIGEPSVSVVEGETKLDSGKTTLEKGTHTVQITHANAEDDLQRKSTLFVTLSLKTEAEAINRYITLNHENKYQTAVTIECGVEAALSWEVSWFEPVGAIELIDGKIVIESEDVEEETTVPVETESSEEGTDPTETESTEEATEPTGSAPTEEPTVPGETETPPAETPTIPIEPGTPSPEDPTESTGTETEPTVAPTDPAPKEPESTESENTETDNTEQTTGSGEN